MIRASASSVPAPTRLPWLDALRGIAIAQMVAYHFCYDLNYFGWIHVALTREPGWIAWRAAIVTQFLFIAGVALALRPDAAGGRVLASRVFWRRWVQVAGAAVLVSAASWALFGARFIWFGVLHFVAVALPLLAPLARWGRACALPGVVALVAGLTLHFDAFAPNALSWIGFSPVKPLTEDFVPLLPWVGVVLLGMAAAGGARHLRGVVPGALRPLVLAGRWPLTVYLLHQPVLFAVLDGVALANR